jgi:hypothetical protein
MALGVLVLFLSVSVLGCLLVALHDLIEMQVDRWRNRRWAEIGVGVRLKNPDAATTWQRAGISKRKLRT